VDLGDNVYGLDPMLVDLDGQDFQPAPGSPLQNAAGPLAGGAAAVEWQYEVHLRGAARADGGIATIGAFDG
jgi:hypothetical protein